MRFNLSVLFERKRNSSCISLPFWIILIVHNGSQLDFKCRLVLLTNVTSTYKCPFLEHTHHKKTIYIYLHYLFYKTPKSPHQITLMRALKTATTYSPTFAVPSAWLGLTSLFGMGRGGTPTL